MHLTHARAPRALRLATALTAGAVLIGGPAAAQSAAPTDVYATPLAGICPDVIGIQTNWYPQPEHGFAYQAIGPGGTVDAEHLTYRGPLGTTGVELEVRAGGPAIGYQQVSSILAQDDSLLLGFVGTDEAIQNSKDAPTVAVFAELEQNPQAFIWGDPAWTFSSIAEIGQSDATVLVREGSTYVDVFLGKGLLRPDQVDTSYQGGVARFAAADGHIVQQAFATSEPYEYEHTPEWGKPVQVLLVHDEYPVYQSALSIRADRLEAERACLELLIPILQQAQVDVTTDPSVVNAILVDYVAQLGGAFTLSAEKAAWSAETLRTLGLVGNGPNDTLGDFETERVQQLVDDLVPVFTAGGKELREGLVAADLFTNDFIDPSIGLP